MINARALVQNELASVESGLENLFNKNNTVLEDLESFIQCGSKRIRSIVALLYLKMNNAKISDDVVKVLISGELIHNASLLHDDVIDDSTKRRGKQNLYGKYSPKISILAGDYLLSIAVNKMLQTDNKEILTIFVNATGNMSDAEIHQFSKRGKEISLDDYTKIIYGKTASLFEAILESSAILSGLDREQAKKFGKNFGILFQVNNDFKAESADNDKANEQMTIKDILGIEKGEIFKDNYKGELRDIFANLKENEYKTALEDLVKNL